MHLFGDVSCTLTTLRDPPAGVVLQQVWDGGAGGYDAGMRKPMGVLALLLSLACLANTVNWIGALAITGWENVPGLMAHKPGETAICAGIAILGLFFLGLGVSLLGPRRRPPA